MTLSELTLLIVVSFGAVVLLTFMSWLLEFIKYGPRQPFHGFKHLTEPEENHYRKQEPYNRYDDYNY